MMKLAFRLFACLFLVTPLSVHAITIDATSFDPVPIEVVATSSGGVPIGTVIIWPYAQNPAEGFWLECDGKIIPVEYDELIALAGNNTPDYQGIFLRGHGEQTSDHYGVVEHKSGALGEIQGDAARKVTGKFGMFSFTYNWGHAPQGTGAFWLGSSPGGSSGVAGGTMPPYFIHFDTSRQVPTDSENRVVNRAVRYLIKAEE